MSEVLPVVGWIFMNNKIARETCTLYIAVETRIRENVEAIKEKCIRLTIIKIV